MGGRTPCCSSNVSTTTSENPKVGLLVKKGPWTPDEDQKLMDYVQKHGHGSWRSLPKHAGLLRCGKSCRLRWTNYLRPDIKRGNFTAEEEQLIINLHALLGNKWSSIASHLPGRTDNEIKNYWNTHLKKRLLQMGLDPLDHKPLIIKSIHYNTSLNYDSNRYRAASAVDDDAPAAGAAHANAAPPPPPHMYDLDQLLLQQQQLGLRTQNYNNINVNPLTICDSTMNNYTTRTAGCSSYTISSNDSSGCSAAFALADPSHCRKFDHDNDDQLHLPTRAENNNGQELIPTAEVALVPTVASVHDPRFVDRKYHVATASSVHPSPTVSKLPPQTNIVGGGGNVNNKIDIVSSGNINNYGEEGNLGIRSSSNIYSSSYEGAAKLKRSNITGEYHGRSAGFLSFPSSYLQQLQSHGLDVSGFLMQQQRQHDWLQSQRRRQLQQAPQSSCGASSVMGVNFHGNDVNVGSHVQRRGDVDDELHQQQQKDISSNFCSVNVSTDGNILMQQQQHYIAAAAAAGSIGSTIDQQLLQQRHSAIVAAAMSSTPDSTCRLISSSHHAILGDKPQRQLSYAEESQSNVDVERTAINGHSALHTSSSTSSTLPHEALLIKPAAGDHRAMAVDNRAAREAYAAEDSALHHTHTKYEQCAAKQQNIKSRAPDPSSTCSTNAAGNVTRQQAEAATAIVTVAAAAVNGGDYVDDAGQYIILPDADVNHCTSPSTSNNASFPWSTPAAHNYFAARPNYNVITPLLKWRWPNDH